MSKFREEKRRLSRYDYDYEYVIMYTLLSHLPVWHWRAYTKDIDSVASTASVSSGMLVSLVWL